MEKSEITYLGPPGTGKTQNNSNLVKQCIERGIEPDRIACVSFTKKAASESRERVSRDWGIEENDLPYFQTLHSMAFRAGGYKPTEVMRPQDHRIIGNEVGLSFYTRTSSNIESDLDSLSGISEGNWYLSLYHLARSKCIPYKEFYRREGDYRIQYSLLERFVEAYEAYKKEFGKIDFTDMIESFIKHDLPMDIDALLVDEAQDLSTLQWKMIDILRRLPDFQVFSGDDDQAIMGFQGADVEAFQNCTANKVVLSKSYRLPISVYDLAQKIVNRISNREPKVWSPRDEDGNVVWHWDLRNVPLQDGEWNLLARTNRIADFYANVLRDQGWIYSRFGKPSISAEVFDAIVNWESWLSGALITMPMIKNIYKHMKEGTGYKKGFSPRTKIFRNPDEETRVSMSMAREHYGLIAPQEMWKIALDGIDLDTKQYVLNARRRGDNVKHPRIKVSTIHSMKGGECDNIILAPDISKAAYSAFGKDPNTEHRVFYVGATRAKKTLHILEPGMGDKYYYPI